MVRPKCRPLYLSRFDELAAATLAIYQFKCPETDLALHNFSKMMHRRAQSGDFSHN
jgi:hypothetical protein